MVRDSTFFKIVSIDCALKELGIPVVMFAAIALIGWLIRLSYFVMAPPQQLGLLAERPALYSHRLDGTLLYEVCTMSLLIGLSICSSHTFFSSMTNL